MSIPSVAAVVTSPSQHSLGRGLPRQLLGWMLIALALGLASGWTHARLSSLLIEAVLLGAAVFLTVFALGGGLILTRHWQRPLQALRQTMEKDPGSGLLPGDFGEQLLQRACARLTELQSDAEKHSRELVRAANRDPLTGLGNRRFLLERLALALNHLRNHPQPPFSLMLIDLDGFKRINDGLGHAAGDAALCEMAKRLRSQLKPNDSLARLGGDSFAMLMFGLPPEAAVRRFAEIRAAIAAPLRLEHRTMSLGAAAGIAAGSVGMTAQEWQRQADLALWTARNKEGSGIAAFEPSMQTRASQRLRMEQELRLAIANQDIEAWFQPIVDGRDGSVLGMEALARWTFEDTPVAPLEFVEMAENTGQIAALGRLVLDKTCSALARLRQRHPDLRCSVNLSVDQFSTSDIENDVLAATAAAELPLDALRLELTESDVAANESELVPAMQRLVEHGARFSLDDFGTGLSSLNRLRSLPIAGIKIDRSFVSQLREQDDVLLRTIYGLCVDLGLDAVAEGVETEEERRGLCDIGCYRMQGFLLARPMNEEALIEWLEHRRVLPAVAIAPAAQTGSYSAQQR